MPAGVILGVVVGYPLVRLAVISTQGFGLRTLITGQTTWIGTANYAAILHDPQLVPILIRTVVFAATLVIGTVVIGLGAAMLMVAVGKRMRVAMMIALLGAWATGHTLGQAVEAGNNPTNRSFSDTFAELRFNGVDSFKELSGAGAATMRITSDPKR